MNELLAYRHCERITRAAAANFYYGIRLLPRRRRLAMCAVYAFARRIDDIGDGPLTPEQKLQQLDQQTRALERLHAPSAQSAGGPRLRPPDAEPDPVLIALASAYRQFAVPADALPALIAGVRMDVEGVSYETFEQLVVYCRRVAGSIGRACLAIFALRTPQRAPDERAWRLADDLGVALQLTNILRDLREDAETGRSYLPAEELRRFGVVAPGQERRAPALIAALARDAGEVDRLDALIGFEATRARAWFQRGIALATLLDRRSAACVLAMAGIYGRLLQRIEADPERALRERLRLPAHEKAWIATRSLLVAATGLSTRGAAGGQGSAAAHEGQAGGSGALGAEAGER